MAGRLQRIAEGGDADLTALAAGAAMMADALNQAPTSVLAKADAAHRLAEDIDNVLAGWFVAEGATTAAVAAGDPVLGRVWSDRSIHFADRLGIEEGSVRFEQRANVLALEMHYDQAARLYGTARTHQLRNGIARWNFPQTDPLVERTRFALGADAFLRAWDGEAVATEPAGDRVRG